MRVGVGCWQLKHENIVRFIGCGLHKWEGDTTENLFLVQVHKIMISFPHDASRPHVVLSIVCVTWELEFKQLFTNQILLGRLYGWDAGVPSTQAEPSDAQKTHPPGCGDFPISRFPDQTAHVA